MVNTDTRIFEIDRRFCGPKNSANGGYACGMFAQAIDGAAEVTLTAPPPLNTPIALRKSADEAWEAYAGDMLVGRARPSALDIAPPPPPSDRAVVAAHDDFVNNLCPDHFIPGCFVCGPDRTTGDGLRLFTGAAPASEINADFWTPTGDLADANGLVRPEFLWAALDCPSYFALREHKVMLLGRMTAMIRTRPEAGARLTVIAWPKGKDGRKFHAGSALYNAKGDALAVADALWVELADPKLIAQLEADRA